MSELIRWCDLLLLVPLLVVAVQLTVNVQAPDLDLLFVAGLEAAFAADVPIRGDEVVFSRIRIRVDVGPSFPTGTYIVRHPFGTEVGEHAFELYARAFIYELGAVSHLLLLEGGARGGIGAAMGTACHSGGGLAQPTIDSVIVTVLTACSMPR